MDSERIFEEMTAPNAPYRVLVDDDYPVTRLSGKPLGFRTSRIDYVIASRRFGPWTGLLGDEIESGVATVRADLVAAHGGPDAFRETYSDHVPVTVTVKVVGDDD